jgi:peptide/nickel transport system substrate-binding protein
MLGLNRRWIMDRAMGGQAILANSPIFPENWAFYDSIETLPFDSEQALRLLKEAGYTIPAEGGGVRSKDGVPLSFELLYPDTPAYAEIAERMRTDWAALGVEVKPVPASPEDILENHLEPRDYQAALVELNLGRYPDPDPYPFWHQAEILDGQNYSGWDDRQASEFLEQARVIDDLPERTRLYRNFQVRFSQELPALLLFYPVYSYGVKDTVQGATMGPLFDPSDRFMTFPSWYLLTSDLAAGAPATATPAP